MQFADEECVDQKIISVIRLYAQTFQTSFKDAKRKLHDYVSPSMGAENARQHESVLCGFLAGIGLGLFGLFAAVFNNNVINPTDNALLEQHPLILRSVRLMVMLCFYGIFFGIDLYTYERRRLNYIFIFELPPGKVVGCYKSVFKFSFTMLSLVSVCSMFSVIKMYIDRNLLEEVPSMIFKTQICTIASILPATCWLLIPPLVVLVNMIVIFVQWKRPSVTMQRIILSTFGMQFLPWKYRVSFPVFFLGD